jgi:hypothetical protein
LLTRRLTQLQPIPVWISDGYVAHAIAHDLDGPSGDPALGKTGKEGIEVVEEQRAQPRAGTVGVGD